MKNIIVAIATGSFRTPVRTATTPVVAVAVAVPAPTVVLYEDHLKEVYGNLNEMCTRLTRFSLGHVFEAVHNYKAGDCLDYAQHTGGVNWCEEQEKVWLQMNPVLRRCDSAPTVQEAIREIWDPASICASL